jgi:hypothetical protein
MSNFSYIYNNDPEFLTTPGKVIDIKNTKENVEGSACYWKHFAFLKNHFGQCITTVGINYNKDLYPVLLKNVAEHHVWLNSARETVDYYIQEFGKINLVPECSINNCDYNILVNDFFDVELLSTHFENLGFPFTPSSQEMYNSWHSAW